MVIPEFKAIMVKTRGIINHILLSMLLIIVIDVMNIALSLMKSIYHWHRLDISNQLCLDLVMNNTQ